MALALHPMIDNYIYLHHTGVYLVLPIYADSVNDQQSVTFAQSSPLSRSAPIYSFTNAGPRTIQFSFRLQRELFKQINYGVSNAVIDSSGGKDYVDYFIKYIQAAALPAYSTADKMVNPPVVSLRLGNDIFIKGVVTGSVGITYNYPILADGRYSTVDINFGVYEISPFDAATVMNIGSFRGVNTSLERTLWTTSMSSQPIANVSIADPIINSPLDGSPKINQTIITPSYDSYKSEDRFFDGRGFSEGSRIHQSDDWQWDDGFHRSTNQTRDSGQTR